MVVDATEPLDALVGEAGLQGVGVGSRARHPDPHIGGQLLQRAQQDVEALAGFVSSDEQHRRAVGGPRLGRREPLHLHPVEHELVVAVEVVPSEVAGVLGHRDAQVQTAGTPLHQRLHGGVGGLGARSVEGADERGGLEQERRDRRPGGERLVEVHDVERLVPQRTDGAELSGGVGGDRGDRAVGRGGQAVAQRGHEQLGRRTVARGQHTGLVPASTHGARQGEDLALHAAGHGQAVRADQADAHRRHPTAGRRSPQRPDRSRRRPGRSRRRRPAPRRRSASWAGAGATARGRPGSGPPWRTRGPG